MFIRVNVKDVISRRAVRDAARTWLALGMLALVACAPSSGTLDVPTGVAGLDFRGVPANAEQVLLAVRLGAVRKGWGVLQEAPGSVIARVTSGGHDATVRIDYNAQGWAIYREDTSPGLRYNPDYGGREVIHHRYNLWVRQLNSAIQAALVDVRNGAAFAAPAPTAGGALSEPSPATPEPTVPPDPAPQAADSDPTPAPAVAPAAPR